MINLDYLCYTYMHRKAFEFVVRKLFTGKSELNIMLLEAKEHDLDKSLLYTMISKQAASEYHRSTCNHHMENELPKSDFDILAAVVDYECAGYTKPDKPRNAYDTVMEFKPTNSDRLIAKMEELGIAKHYLNTPYDPAWTAFKRDIHPPTDENIMAEIYWYINRYPDRYMELYGYAQDWRNAHPEWGE